MAIKKLDAAALQSWVDRLIAKQAVVGPRANGSHFAFGPLTAAADLRLDHDVTILPPKKYLLPQVDTLLTFSREGRYQSVVTAPPLVLFGVHPYDVVAIQQMDAVFAKDHRDVHYLARRQNATVVACDIQALSPNVFASCMGTATVQDGFDVLLTRIGDVYLADARTRQGRALLREAGDLPNASRADRARREQVWDDNRRLLRRHDLKCDPRELPALLDRPEAYDHPMWAEKGAKCYSCGSCNLVCPTCYCFDVQDDLDWDLTNGRRVRKWDGCLLTDFAVAAGGHNFRKGRDARYRHRYYRKGKYLWERMGQIACVGCGRCVTACTAKIANPVEVYNTLLEVK